MKRKNEANLSVKEKILRPTRIEHLFSSQYDSGSSLEKSDFGISSSSEDEVEEDEYGNLRIQQKKAKTKIEEKRMRKIME